MTSDLRAVELHGRLGNQLFQLALVRALIDPDLPVPVESVRAGDWMAGSVRPEAYRQLDWRESLRLGRPPSGRARRQLQAVVKRTADEGRAGVLGTHVYAERAQGVFDAELQHAPTPVLYSGFFQHEDYFRHRGDEVASALLPMSSEAAELLAGAEAQAPGAPSVAVVIRAAGDYVRIGWDLPYDWYWSGVERVVAGLPSCRFLVCSDTPMVAEAFARALRQFGPATPVLGRSPLDQLHLIASCDHAVVASSSFAWWGAWLGDQRRAYDPDRVVVAPDPWIEPGLDTVPHRWTKLDTHTTSGSPS